MNIYILFLMMSVSVAMVTGKAKFYKTNKGKKVRGSYIVVLKQDDENITKYEQRLLDKHYGVTVINRFHDVLNGFAIQVPDSDSDDEMLHVITEIIDDPSVQYVEEDAYVEIAATANSWGLDRIDQENLPLDNQYNPPGNGAGINVYVVDTGIHDANKDFPKSSQGGPKDFLDLSGQKKNRDCNGHGTHVAGTIGSNSYGVSPNVQLWNVRVFDCSGSGPWSNVISAINEIGSRGIQPGIINLSISGVLSQAANDALANIRSKGYLPIAAAGNNIGKDACSYSPGASPNAITVGGTMDDDSFWVASNTGECVNINAPAFDIISLANSRTGTRVLTGTSMATPHVSGIAAVIWEQNPTWTADQVEQEVYARATPGKITGLPPTTVNLLSNINE